MTNEPEITIEYPVWRVDPPYKILVFASNLLSNESVETEIAVQRTIQPLTGFKLLHEPENSTEAMKVVLDIATGDYFDCTFNWGDGSATELMTWNAFNSTTPRGIKFHQFEAGKFEVYFSNIFRGESRTLTGSGQNNEKKTTLYTKYICLLSNDLNIYFFRF